MYKTGVIYSESLSACLEACSSIIVGAERLLVDARKSVPEGEYPLPRIIIGWIEDGENPRLCDGGLFGKADSEISNVLRVLGFANTVKILSDETFDFDLDAVSSTKSSSTTLILIRTLPIKPVEFPCLRTGFAVYEQREDQFVLASSVCKFHHESGKIAIKSTCDEQGTVGIHYWLKIRDVMTAGSVNVVLQK